MLAWILAFACKPERADDTAASDTVPWRADLPTLRDDITVARGAVPLRTIIHLHSPYSHDACDEAGYVVAEGGVDRVLDEACLADLRSGLCRTAVDVAFATDHPDFADVQPFEDLLLARDGDTPIARSSGTPVANGIACTEGAQDQVLWLPGIEDELMPVGLERHVSDDPAVSHEIYNASTAEALQAEAEAGALVFVPHTEGRQLADLEALQDSGLRGVEVFNLHAMFAPDIRADFLGLDAWGWVQDIAPFTDDHPTVEPDLLFLGVLQAQAPSLAAFDALLARGPMVATAGTDAHQNVIPNELADGERADSYRRMLRWFSNVLLAGERTPDGAREALAAGRGYVAFDVLGTPDGFDFVLETGDGSVAEMGATVGTDALPSTLVVGCPSLSRSSPRGSDAPEITVTVWRDGQPWASGCGELPVTEAGVYRAEVTMIPWHLAPFLGGDAAPWMHAYPWVYGNAIRILD
jgi:hypothetical protein